MSAASQEQGVDRGFDRFRIGQLKMQIVALQLWITLVSVLLPVSGIVILGYYCKSLPDNSAQAFWSSTMVAVGAMVIGGFLGFLFAIPRAQDPEKLSGLPQRSRPFVVNTNFEQISDWLTKIIVGVTLIQLNEILAKLGQVTGEIAKIFGGQAGATLVAAGFLHTFPPLGS